jgi:hypothetical protein
MPMFGGFDFLGQVIQGSPGPASGPGGGGFPGIFPGAGVSNSGWAGWNEFQARNQRPCTTDDVVKGRCVMGPAGVLGGASHTR